MFLKEILHNLYYGSLWRPRYATFAMSQVVGRTRSLKRNHSDRGHIQAAASWLERAQDATVDGGVSGRFRLKGGWTSSYPETTGYLIPTFLNLAKEGYGEKFVDRARRCTEFLLSIQLENGAFPGGEIAKNQSNPSYFNSAQILHGLLAWYRHSKDQKVLDAATRAAHWLVSIQDADGAWRKFGYGEPETYTYSAHAACWVAELGDFIGDKQLLRGSRMHLEWTLGHRDAKTGWIDKCGFSQRDHDTQIAVTHTIAYTLWGVLFSSQILKNDDGINAVRQAAGRVARRVELHKGLPGILDSRWRSQARFACLTGNAQMALIWFRLNAIENNDQFINAALKALDIVKAAQPIDSKVPGIRGGIPGSLPVWGGYIRNAIPNWAAKFFIDALLEKQHLLAEQVGRQPNPWVLGDDVPTQLPHVTDTEQQALQVVLLTSPKSVKPAQMIEEWKDFGFKPAAIVVEHQPRRKLIQRRLAQIAEEGVMSTFRRIISRGTRTSRPSAKQSDVVATSDLLTSHQQSKLTGAATPAKLARQLEIPIVHVGRLDDPQSLKIIRSLQPDLAIHAGAGILRVPLLNIPRLGTLNAHMGLLPYFRGMNVTEWSAYRGSQVGCSVHLIDTGIDTGDILCVRPVDVSSAGSIKRMRYLVNVMQVKLLGEVLQYILRTGNLPPRYRQSKDEGVQFFQMAPDLRKQLEEELAQRADTQPAIVNKQAGTRC